MAIHIVTGLPGSGKSYYTAEVSLDLLYQNREWYKKSGVLRKICTNLKLSQEIENEFGFGTDQSFISYWEDVLELPRMRDVDVIWEEMGVICDARQWENMPLELKRWLQQHRHRGCDIYGNVQEFADIDVAVRRLTKELIYLTKIMGSPDPSPTRPPIKKIWGIVVKYRIDPKNYKEDMKWSEGRSSLDGFFFLTRKVVSVYDMHNDIKTGKYPPLQHRMRECETCGFKKIIHV